MLYIYFRAYFIVPEDTFPILKLTDLSVIESTVCRANYRANLLTSSSFRATNLLSCGVSLSITVSVSGGLVAFTVLD